VFEDVMFAPDHRSVGRATARQLRRAMMPNDSFDLVMLHDPGHGLEERILLEPLGN